jgi:response regulator NasT
MGGGTVVPHINVLLGISSDELREGMKDILTGSGCRILAETTSVPDLLRKVRAISCDLVIMDLQLSGGNVLEAARIVEEDDLSVVLLLVSDLSSQEVRYFHYLLLPVARRSVIAAIDAVMLYKNRIQSLRQDLHKLREAMNNRKLIEKAKGILMKSLRLDEQDAYRLLQKQSMDRGVPMKDIAAAVILASEIEGNK